MIRLLTAKNTFDGGSASRKIPQVRTHRCYPLGADTAHPRLSWVLDYDRRGQKQSAYQVLVAWSEDDLRTEENLVWDSGKVASDRSVGVEYVGQEPRSGSRCVWMVCIWDGGKPFTLQRDSGVADGPSRKV
jgi:hypothetical protein